MSMTGKRDRKHANNVNKLMSSARSGLTVPTYAASYAVGKIEQLKPDYDMDKREYKMQQKVQNDQLRLEERIRQLQARIDDLYGALLLERLKQAEPGRSKKAG